MLVFFPETIADVYYFGAFLLGLCGEIPYLELFVGAVLDLQQVAHANTMLMEHMRHHRHQFLFWWLCACGTNEVVWCWCVGAVVV